MKDYVLHLGDCVKVLKTLPDNSVDAIVTDPPYGLSKEPDMAEVLRHWLAGDDYTATGGGFMGKTWDSFVPGPAVWREAMRVLKPGGHLLAFFGSRTCDMGTLAIRLAGFEIRDQIMWIYGSGFPKSRNLDGEWQGWGTALKPAHEPICVARKPIQGTVTANVLEFGTGALNIDGCRVATDDNQSRPRGSFPHSDDTWGNGRPNEVSQSHQAGRWPANLIHDGSDEVVAAFPQASGAMAPVRGTEASSKTANAFGEFAGRVPSDQRDGGGSAARFFYCAKASKRDRDEGLDDIEAKPTAFGNQAQAELKRGNLDHSDGKSGMNKVMMRKNTHPTVKPTDLMAYLVRLVTPPGGTVLDPFMGSGSTGKAAMREGFRFIGIDMTPEYVEIANARIESELKKRLARAEPSIGIDAQLPLFDQGAA